MKLKITTILIGMKPRSIEIDVNENSILKDIVEINYLQVSPGAKKLNKLSEFNSWSNFTLSYLKEAQEFLPYSFLYKSKNNKLKNINLIDTIGSLNTEEIVLSRGSRTDDSLWFFLLEMKDDVNAICLETSDDDLKLIRFFEKKLSNIESHILIDRFISSGVKHDVIKVVKEFIPSNVLTALNISTLDYYKEFLFEFSSNIFMLNECIDNINIDTTNKEAYRGWIKNYTYKVQYELFNVFNLPEIFISDIPKRGYHASLKEIGLTYAENDKFLYDRHIKRQSITQIFKAILINEGITNYTDWIYFCKNKDLSNATLNLCIQLFRIIHNKLKHSSSIQVIKSRNYRKIKEGKLKDINKKILSIKNSNLSEYEISQKLSLVNLEKEVIEKVTYSYSNFDYDDANFLNNNGVYVYGTEDEDHFFILLSDLEYSVKILIGILCILDRAKSNG